MHDYYGVINVVIVKLYCWELVNNITSGDLVPNFSTKVCDTQNCQFKIEMFLQPSLILL